MTYSLTTADDGSGLSFTVCSDAFRSAYGISKYYHKLICKDIKNGVLNNSPSFFDHSAIPKAIVDKIVRWADRLKIDLSHQQRGDLEIANNPTTLSVSFVLIMFDPSIFTLFCFSYLLQAAAWMKFFFDCVGDKIPDSNNEIHLEVMEKTEIWKEYDYFRSTVMMDPKGLSYNSFIELWDLAFPHVKIRVYKQVMQRFI
jgi:hypothetical protein